MKKLWGMKNKIIYVYLIFLAIAIATVFVCIFKTNFENNNDYIDFMGEWYAEDKLADLSEVHQYKEITKTLPEIKKDTYLYMNVKSINVEIYVDDECIYKYPEYDKVLFGKTPGSYFINIDLYREYSNKEITIKMDNAYNDTHGKILKMYIGDSADIIINFTVDHLLGNLFSSIIIFIGVTLLLIFAIFKAYKKDYMNLLYLGLFALIIGLFTFTDSKFLQVVDGNETFYHVVSEICMLLIVVPIIQYVGNIYFSSGNRKVNRLLCLLGLLNFVICYLLHMTGVLDFHQTIRITHFTYIICAIYIIYLCIKSVINKNKDEVLHTIGFMFVCVFVILDILLIYFADLKDSSLFTRLGVLIFLLSEFIQFMLETLKEFKRYQRISLLDKLAYQDGLTELLNRTSFMEDMEKLKDEDKGLVAVIDVNNLKLVNDNFGHTSGDVLIIKIAEIMKKYLGPLGKCYRIGGDEFVFISTASRHEECYKAIDKMNAYFVAYNKTEKRPYKIEYAVGTALVNKNNTFQEAFDKADKKMYANKRKMKNK